MNLPPEELEKMYCVDCGGIIDEFRCSRGCPQDRTDYTKRPREKMGVAYYRLSSTKNLEHTSEHR